MQAPRYLTRGGPVSLDGSEFSSMCKVIPKSAAVGVTFVYTLINS